MVGMVLLEVQEGVWVLVSWVWVLMSLVLSWHQGEALAWEAGLAAQHLQAAVQGAVAVQEAPCAVEEAAVEEAVQELEQEEDVAHHSHHHLPPDEAHPHRRQGSWVGWVGEEVQIG